MKLEEIKELCLTIPMPYIAHFRIASVGGIRKSLTHPFPISEDAPLELEGTTKGAVLFHNGTWHSWSDKIIDTAVHTDFKLPIGEWSDSRALAWMTHICGPGFMEVLPGQRGVYFSTTRADVYIGPGWKFINGVWCSNDSPETKSYKTTRNTHSHHNAGKVCAAPSCRNFSFGNDELCYTCREKVKKEKEVLGLPSGNPPQGSLTEKSGTSSTKTSQAAPLTGGTASPLLSPLPMNEAMELYRLEGMTHKDLKKFQKLYSQLRRANSDKRKSRVLLRIREHSTKVCRSQTQVHG
jgi:hypothetical protein